MPDFNRLVAKKKKEAIADNPALAFISQPDEPAGHPSGGEAGADPKRVPGLVHEQAEFAFLFGTVRNARAGHFVKIEALGEFIKK